MRWDRPKSIGAVVEAKATNRPLKIAYFVPYSEEPNTHLILDAVFFESYTRWAGVYTLVLPTDAQHFLDPQYADWLAHYDPDFIYSYIDLDADFVRKVDHLSCPIAVLKHERRNLLDNDIDWRTFLPDWGHYFHPVSSISTAPSPQSRPPYSHSEMPREPTVFTQFGMDPTDRFLADNFGTGFDLHTVTHAIPGLLRTLCLTPVGLPENVIAGSERCSSRLEALRALIERKATPIARMAAANSEMMPRIEARAWASAFRIFIGSTSLDRIHFWNSRHLAERWVGSSSAIIIEPGFTDDDLLIKELGKYLNSNNYLGGGSGQRQAEIHSYSLSRDALNVIAGKLKPHTWNSVRVSDKFNLRPVPSTKDIQERMPTKGTDVVSIKLTEDFSEVSASEPVHFAYMPPQLKGFVHGQWIVELDIQRHNNLSKYSNVIDTWTLPRRRKIARAFTERLAKPTSSGQLAVLPATKEFPFRNQSINHQVFYEITLPSDEAFFRHLALNFFKYPVDDLRSQLTDPGFIDVKISDKGQNLRGVISLFDDLSEAFGILTKKFWRSVFENAKDDTAKPLTFKWDKLHSLVPNDQTTIKRITREFRFDNDGTTKNFLRDGLLDTLERLVRSSVFFQVAHWRCRFCGNQNSRSFDNMKLKNECSICATQFIAPIDIEWRYELSEFVYRSLHKHSGLVVLWAIGHLQEQMYSGSFWYLPEVDLYERYDDPESKNEVDILCVVDGSFYVVEAKRSASLFLNKEGSIEKFTKMVELLRPDVAMLAFERYCPEGENVEETKRRLAETVAQIRGKMTGFAKLELIIADDMDDFSTFSADFGWHGPRQGKYT